MCISMYCMHWYVWLVLVYIAGISASCIYLHVLYIGMCCMYGLVCMYGLGYVLYVCVCIISIEVYYMYWSVLYVL